MGTKLNLENLELQAKKKKSKLIVVFVVGIFGFIAVSFVSYFLSIDNTKIYEKRKIDKLEGLDIIKNPEYKENWAIAIENRLKKQEKRTMEVVEILKNKQDSIISELKGIINENNKNLTAQVSLIKDSEASRYKNLKNMIEAKINEQNARIDQLEKMKSSNFRDRFNEDNIGDDVILGEDMLPELSPQNKKIEKEEEENISKNEEKTPLDLKPISKMTEKEKIALAIKKNPNLSAEDKLNFQKTIEESTKEQEKYNPKAEIENDDEDLSEEEKPKNVSQKKKMVVINIDTDFNQKIIKAHNQIMKESEVKEETAFKAYHISTGFTQAYMVTGAYAPAFQAGDMEPLPVLFETEGDIVMSNNVRGNIEKCFMLGSAKGNMNSETADIKLVSISCLINGGKARIEGTISGWVIGENGTPGLQGEMIHKNGAWLARTFVSGFFSTFSQALSGGNVTDINLGSTANGTTDDTTSTSTAVNDNLLYAGASGISDVFSKLGDYYIKMAEQIFPVIEVKGGRTVNILLIGGEDLTVVENNKVDMADMNNISRKIELEKRQKKGKITSVNAFTKVISESNNNSYSSANVKKSSKNEELEDIPEIIK